MLKKYALKFFLVFFILTILLYGGNPLINYSFLKLSGSSVSLAYPPPSTPSGSFTINSRVYLPLITKNFYVPPYTTSLYLDTLDVNTIGELGCSLGKSLGGALGRQDSAVILDFCQPFTQSGVQGVFLCDNSGFARIAESGTLPSVEKAAKTFASNFYNCSYGKPDTLVMVIGTNNYGGLVTSQNGSVWATMVNSVNDWLIHNNNYFYRVKAVGGSDMELGYNNYNTTLNWVTGYESTNLYALHDFGDAHGCPTEREPVGINGLCQVSETVTWYQSQVWNISYNNSREAFPLIYNTRGTNAKQWYSLSAFSYVNHGAHMPIFGAVTEMQACLDRGGCVEIDNTPAMGYPQLQYWLNQDPDTAHDLMWSTDFRHHSDMQ